MKYKLSEVLDNPNNDFSRIQSKFINEAQSNTHKPKSPFKYNPQISTFSSPNSRDGRKSRDVSNKRLKNYLINTSPLMEESKKESEILPIFQSRGFNQISIEEITNRRFSPNTINKYKDLFKNRYVSSNAQTDINLSTNNLRLSTQKSVEMKQFIHESPKNLMIQNKQSLHFAPDNRNVIKYASFYIQKVQKAILLFNSKKYEDSYAYLINKAIIFNEKEFGQLLLITNGFDKSEIGNFLSKQKAPNSEYKVLNEFINAMCYVDLDFSKAFRFLLRRINLPQDSGLTLKIIEVFSNCFYNDNKSSGFYLNETSIYLLASTVLAINTLFTRTDIRNMKMISKEEFVSMNHTTSSLIAGNVYEEIKMKRLDIVYDYTEMFNKRLGRIMNADSEEILKTFTNLDSLNNDNANDNDNENQKEKEHDNKKEIVLLGKEEESGNHLNHNLINNIDKPNHKIADSNSIHLEDIRIGNIEGDELIEFLKVGSKFLKYCPQSKPHFRYVYLDKTESKINWMKISFCKLFQCPKSMSVQDIMGVYIGAGHSQVFDKALISPEFDQYCFTIESSKRTLDIRNDNDSICDKWYKGIKYLIQRNLSSFNVKDVYPSVVNSINEKVSLIWETEVITNWPLFRPFLLLKEQFVLEKKYFTLKKSLSAKLQTPLKPKERLLTVYNKNDFIYLYMQFGIPTWLRSKIWHILIGNNLNITDEMISKYTDTNNNSINININANISLIEINQMEKDIGKIAKDMIRINQLKVNYKLYYENIIQSTRTFLYMRSDIMYSKNFAFFLSIFLLNSERSVEAYKLFYNFVYSKCDFIIKFHLRDEWFIKNRIDFFEAIFRGALPKLFRHFHDFDISTSLFFYNWYEFLFVKYFFRRYSLLLQLWDIFLIKGELFIFELGIVLLKLLEKRFLNLAIKDILKDLKTFPEEAIKEKDLISGIEEIDLSSKYCNMVNENLLANEKGILYKK